MIDGKDGKDGRDGIDGVTPDMSEYLKKSYVDDELLAIRESMIPLIRELHSHENIAVLDSITAEQVAMFGEFQDSTKYEIQTLRDPLIPLFRRHTGIITLQF